MAVPAEVEEIVRDTLLAAAQRLVDGAFTAWFASGAGMMPSVRANSTPARSRRSVVRTRVDQVQLLQQTHERRHPW